MTTLRDRCKTIHQQIQRDAMLRQGSPVETLLAFVMAETGRAADQSLADSLPVCLYFRNEQDRTEFIDMVLQLMPNMIAKRMP